MSEINVRLKHNFEDSDKLFRILFAAIKIGKPASKRKIADVADISSQLVDYHIDKLVDNGQLIKVDSLENIVWAWCYVHWGAVIYGLSCSGARNDCW